jgi:hypothetical protein
VVDSYIAERVGIAAKAVIDDFSIDDEDDRPRIFNSRCSPRALGEKLLGELEAYGYVIVKVPIA